MICSYIPISLLLTSLLAVTCLTAKASGHSSSLPVEQSRERRAATESEMGSGQGSSSGDAASSRARRESPLAGTGLESDPARSDMEHIVKTLAASDFGYKPLYPADLEVDDSEDDSTDPYGDIAASDERLSDWNRPSSRSKRQQRLFVGKRAAAGQDLVSAIAKRVQDFVSKRRLFVGKRRLFVGKRDDRGDSFDGDMDAEKRRLFVGKRRLFVGKRNEDSINDLINEAEKRRLFVGKRRLFVGKRDPTVDDLLDELSAQYSPAEKRRLFVGKRRLFVGKRDSSTLDDDYWVNDGSQFDVADKRRLFVGKRRLFVGKRDSVDDDTLSEREGSLYLPSDKRRLFVGKRRLFVGKREGPAYDSLMDYTPEQKRRLFVGKRRLFVGKRDPEFSTDLESASRR